ncbi:unnamed protein product [Orchesella dallaii]|uniref:Uncharacterized protein n=1 Tax=Orchesella dallaii TaxID=48710 RepID=A0ABP1RX03_9HEXA
MPGLPYYVLLELVNRDAKAKTKKESCKDAFREGKGRDEQEKNVVDLVRRLFGVQLSHKDSSQFDTIKNKKEELDVELVFILLTSSLLLLKRRDERGIALRISYHHIPSRSSQVNKREKEEAKERASNITPKQLFGISRNSDGMEFIVPFQSPSL